MSVYIQHNKSIQGNSPLEPHHPYHHSYTTPTLKRGLQTPHKEYTGKQSSLYTVQGPHHPYHHSYTTPTLKSGLPALVCWSYTNVGNPRWWFCSARPRSLVPTLKSGLPALVRWSYRTPLVVSYLEERVAHVGVLVVQNPVGGFLP